LRYTRTLGGGAVHWAKCLFCAVGGNGLEPLTLSV
jgi:hypothetical protein